MVLEACVERENIAFPSFARVRTPSKGVTSFGVRKNASKTFFIRALPADKIREP